MESNKKKINIIGKIRHAYRKFMFTEDAVKEMEELDNKPFKERLKKRKWTYIYVAVCIIVMTVWLCIYYNNQSKKNQFDEEGVYLTEELKGEKKEIESGDMTKYMIDTINKSYVKIAQTKLGDNVAYSLTYRYDIIPENEMTATRYFTTGYMASILINGYPNVSYEEMGLESEEEAYLATQLAVYELVSQKQYSSAIGKFSLDEIQPSEEQYKDMVERIVAKAKEIYSKSISNPYSVVTDSIIDDENTDMTIDGNVAMVGPISAISTTDDVTKKVMGDEFNPITKIEVKSFIDDSVAKVVDKDRNEVTSVGNGEIFYIKIDGTDKIFSQFKIYSNTNYLYARIYETTECEKQYVMLESKEISYIDILSAYHNVDVGSAEIKFQTDNNEIVDKVSYYIYDENDTLLQNIDGFSSDFEILLPEGKYYIKVYDIPEDYFLDGNIHEFEVIKGQDTLLELNMDSLKDLR